MRMADIALSPTQRATEPTAATDAARLAAGVTAGDYVVERFLGAGAMGEVYAGKHPEIGKRVAIKVLKPSLAASEEAAERFKREARIVNRIDHPHVIDVFAFGRLDDGRLYLVMDLVDGHTLRTAVADGPLDIPTTLDILDQIADALDAAHAKGVVHRDLKPDNVMITGTPPPRGDVPPKVHVLDFGIAKLVDPVQPGWTSKGGPAPATLLTGQGAWIGTPGYMAPEQWSSEGAGPASDRYALGVMAFELLSGKLPFQAPTLPQMMEQHFRAPVPALSTRGAVATRSIFDPVLSRAMAKDPDKRYPTAKALVAALREAAGKKHRLIVAPRRVWVPAAIGAGVLGVAVAGVLAVRGGPSPRAGATRSSDLVQVEIRSNPPRATVMRGDTMFGTTPARLDVRAGEQLELTIKKPGYAPVQKSLAANEDTRAIDVVLVQVNGFEGTWVLPDGQLRAFTRSGDDHVDVFKLASLTSEKEFYRKFLLEDAPAGIKFASTETVIDERAPNEPSCQVPVRVEYEYDPQRDALEVRPENVETGFQNGRCVVHSRELVAAIPLVRADRTADTRLGHAPVGTPIDAPSLRRTGDGLANDTLDNAFDVKQKTVAPTSTDRSDPALDKKLQLLKQQEAKKKKLAKPTTKPADLKLNDLSGSKDSNAAPPKQSKAPPQAPPQVPPQVQNAPDDTAQQVRGDSQVAPNRQKK